MTPLAARRIAAWCVDWLIIIGYAVALVPLGLLLTARSVELSPGAWNLVSFALLVAPVTGWLAFWEAAPRGASPGKRLLRLRVRTPAGPAPSLPRALVRNALKVALPWELGHTAVFTLAAPSSAAPTPSELAGMVCGIAACVIVLGYAVSLFLGRTPYDLVAGTSVASGDGRAAAR